MSSMVSLQILLVQRILYTHTFPVLLVTHYASNVILYTNIHGSVLPYDQFSSSYLTRQLLGSIGFSFYYFRCISNTHTDNGYVQQDACMYALTHAHIHAHYTTNTHTHAHTQTSLSDDISTI